MRSGSGNQAVGSTSFRADQKQRFAHGPPPTLIQKALPINTILNQRGINTLGFELALICKSCMDLSHSQIRSVHSAMLASNHLVLRSCTHVQYTGQTTWPLTYQFPFLAAALLTDLICTEKQAVSNMSGDAIDRDFSSSREFLSMGALRVMGMESRDINLYVSEKSPSGNLLHKPKKVVIGIMRSLIRALSIPVLRKCPSYKKPCLGSRVTGTLFGYRRGRVHFAVQEDPRSNPVLLLELATLTNSLVKEMASGLVRIALECERRVNRGKLFQEPRWSMYCNGRKRGYAMRRVWCETDLRILSMVQVVSMGAGVLPMEEEGPDHGELMYMRATFERVVGSIDSEAFYMMNPDGSGGPELSIFLLRI
eukprot:Gb_38762 [translate_table: standard]